MRYREKWPRLLKSRSSGFSRRWADTGRLRWQPILAYAAALGIHLRSLHRCDSIPEPTLGRAVPRLVPDYTQPHLIALPAGPVFSKALSKAKKNAQNAQRGRNRSGIMDHAATEGLSSLWRGYYEKPVPCRITCSPRLQTRGSSSASGTKQGGPRPCQADKADVGIPSTSLGTTSHENL